MIAPSSVFFSFVEFLCPNSSVFKFKLIIAGNHNSSASKLLLVNPAREANSFHTISAKSHFRGFQKGYPAPVRRMITRAKLVEQLREYQIRSQHKCPALTIFSPKPQIISSADVTVAILFAILFSVLVISSYVTLYFRHFWLSFFIICLGILLPISLRISRQALARKRERRMLLPLSM